MSTQTTLNLSSPEADGTVECLGHTFPSDAARREHYLRLLAEKLRDPEYRKIEGFPIGEDEDILALSDPPYYTACPNPWIGEFITHYGRPYDPKEPYHREPFAADVSEGKNHPIYNAHSYHTKVPHRAIMRYLLHYTEPGDVVFDGFCGTGMTGVAAQLCGDRNEVQALGYRVDAKGVIFDESGREVSKLGARIAALNDLSTTASFISYNSTIPVASEEFVEKSKSIFEDIERQYDWMFQTNHTDGTKRRIDFTIWSEIFSCPECGAEVVFRDRAVQTGSDDVATDFTCRQCSAALNKRNLQRVFESKVDPATGKIWKRIRFVPHEIHYRVGREAFKKAPDASDFEIIERINELPFPDHVPTNEWPISKMYHGSRIEPKGFTRTHHFFLPRVTQWLGLVFSRIWKEPDHRVRTALLYYFEQAIWTSSVMNRYQPQGFKQVNKFLPGVYYIPSVTCEVSPWYAIGGRMKRLGVLFQSLNNHCSPILTSTQSTTTTAVPDNSLDYVFTDPPFGENIFYADMNILVESWYGVSTCPTEEAIIDNHKGKDLKSYQALMLESFRVYFAALKPGRWITVEFSNSKASVWNSIQSTLQEAGFVVANVAALDKKLRSFRSVTSPTAVKQDLVISAYKPNGGLEERFKKSGHTPEGVWDFMKTHLRNLPVVKPRGGELEFIAERDPRILYDRMVAFYVGHGVPVPLSSAEFQAGLAEKFPEREGMAFLAEQVAEFDKKRAQMQGVGQMSIFVEDEKSAIDWLRGELKKSPATYQDIQPKFMQQLGASWKKFETRPELALLLEQNFLQYRGDGEVPGQIHSYLSTQNKDLRNLPKDDARLRSRAKDRWYVPDPAKAIDREEFRNKQLRREFIGLCDEAGVPLPTPGGTNQVQLPLVLAAAKKSVRKKLKEVRTEAVRLGFKECFAAKDYATILALAAHLPNNVIEEDEQLQMIFDMAEMRAGG